MAKLRTKIKGFKKHSLDTRKETRKDMSAYRGHMKINWFLAKALKNA